MNILVTNEGLDQVVSGLFQFKQGLEFESLCMQQPSLGDSPTISSRPCLIPLFTNQFNAGHHPSPHLELTNAKQSTVFWRNWKRQNHKSNHQFDDDADADADAPSSSWVQDDSLSDARNGPIPKVTCIYPTFALLPSYSGAGTQILSLQQWQSRGTKGKQNTTATTTPSPYVLSANQQLKDDSDEDLHTISSGASPLLLNTKPKPKPKMTKARLKKTRRKLHKDDSLPLPPPLRRAQLVLVKDKDYHNEKQIAPSNVGSSDATTTSFIDGDDEVDDPLDLPARQGCGIPCYWSKRPSKHKTLCRNCCSSSFSATPRGKGTSILCGAQSVYTGHRQFTELNPIGYVPVLVDGDVVVSGSFAILMYLEEKYPEHPLLPSNLNKRAILING
ncbi:hypothetical protein SLEP1_g56076 [Rubroshorea leprosula]|uniref:GST N-terminal domain-containing protein n=1 Tax=Rubroshorea leprosula TaxID=152421 RepID=A0AAV5MIJ0_9ROSI|nr:hypothetical protein SLEP1_g56076 [Rubroshorea leprosula]